MTIGARLKSAREAKGLTLKEASHLTKIQQRTLQAIEEDRVEEMLEAAYAKIFLKKYAGFLGLDGAALSSEYVNLHRLVPEESPRAAADRQRQEFGDSAKKWLLVGSAVGGFLIGISFLAYLAVDLYGTLNQQSKPRAASAVAKARSPSTDEKPAAPKFLVPKSQALKLTIRTKADVWMQVKSDGSVIFQNVLSKGSQESWTAKEELEIWTGNAGAMELVLNGKSLGPPGSGVKKGIRVTHAGLRLPE